VRRLVLAVQVLAFGGPALLQGQDLMRTPIGFRTGLTEGAVTTRPGTLTVDAGASARWTGGAAIYRAGEFNVRVPFTARLEGRVYANSYAWRRDGGENPDGREDLSLALAAMLVSYRGLRPVTALILRMDTPTGTLPAREHTWRPSARASVGWELPGRLALHCNLGVGRDTRGGEGFVREIASVWIARRIAGRLGAYAEALGSSRERSGGPAAGFLHGGITLLVRSWMHLDVNGGVGSASAGSPRWIGIGMRQRVDLRPAGTR
jgi:hypothetical protein